MPTSLQTALTRANAANQTLAEAQTEYFLARAQLENEFRLANRPRLMACEVCAGEFLGTGQVCEICANFRQNRQA
jgi:hypothetical protein